MPSIGGRNAYEPVATIALLKLTSSPPSTAIVFASLKRPLPRTHSTPFALKSVATPPVSWSTILSFQTFAAAKSSSGAPTVTPSLGKVSSASFSAKAVCTQALVGMQPTRRHVPPSRSSFSTQTVVAPSCAARIAAVYPPGPPPRTATSHSMLWPFPSVRVPNRDPIRGGALAERLKREGGPCAALAVNPGLNPVSQQVTTAGLSRAIPRKGGAPAAESQGAESSPTDPARAGGGCRRGRRRRAGGSFPESPPPCRLRRRPRAGAPPRP